MNTNNLIISELHYDYSPPMCTSTQGIGEQWKELKVGKAGVLEIQEHMPQGEGDRFYYDVLFDDGSMFRTFNPNKVFFNTKKAE